MPRTILILALTAAAAALTVTATAGPAAAQTCRLPPLATDGFVRVEGTRLMLGDQPYLVRGAHYGGGKFLAPFSTGSPHGMLEEFYGGSAFFNDPFVPAAIEAELAFHRVQFGSNTLRIMYSMGVAPVDPVRLARWHEVLCRARRQGIRIHVSLLVGVPTSDAQHDSLVAQYTSFLQSFLPALRDDPTLMAWEVGNEIIRQQTPMDHKVRALRLIRAVIAVIGANDANHLITSGEVMGGPLPYITPEYVPIPVDGPSAPSVTLEQLVDYVSPHVYGRADLDGGTWIEDAGAALRAGSSKPIVAGEFGWFVPDELVLDKAFYQTPQKRFFSRYLAVMRTHHLSGWMPWLPMPMLDLRPGRFTKEMHVPFPWPSISLLDENRRVHYRDQWDLMYYPSAAPGSPLVHLAAGTVLRRSLTTRFDLGGDGSADVAVFRPATGQWLTAGGGVHALGVATDVMATADFDGDGRSDPALFRDGLWLIGSGPAALLGQAGDVPVPADYDGDGVAEVAIYRAGTWIVRAGGIDQIRILGAAGDVAVPADYDGDGRTELAVFRPSTGVWTAVRLDGTPVATGPAFGGAGDIAAPADYDGDGRANLAVFRPANATWYVAGLIAVTYGATGDVPVPADYDGDGITDIAVFRPSTNQWHLRTIGTRSFGVAGDRPVPAR